MYEYGIRILRIKYTFQNRKQQFKIRAHKNIKKKFPLKKNISMTKLNEH